MFDYAAGKSDWLAAGLPYEGDADLVARHLEREVPTCDVRDPAGDVAAGNAGAAEVVVLGAGGVVMGTLDPAEVDAGDTRAAFEVAAPAPTSVRASEVVDDLQHRMTRAGVRSVLVTAPEGTLLGRFSTG